MRALYWMAGFAVGLGVVYLLRPRYYPPIYRVDGIYRIPEDSRLTDLLTELEAGLNGTL